MPLVDNEGFTQLAMPDQNTGHGLHARFFMHPVQDKAASLEAGRPIFEEVPYIVIRIPGDKTSEIKRPIRFGDTTAHDNNKFAREYEAFKLGNEQSLLGTPLSEWGAITRSQVKEMEHFHIRTVEQLSEMPDSTLGNFRGITSIREKARNYIAAAKGEAPMLKMQEELAERDVAMKAMQAQINELVSELGDTKEVTPKKRRKPVTE
jgi:hypothetical protein